ncbi:MAG: hypothetical protein AB7F22_09495 [Reyranella sp.]|uniref:pectate lyase family protein n=1 Tax=Reyranella sp. TaxID=1929291 RepID=UPI003D134029
MTTYYRYALAMLLACLVGQSSLVAAQSKAVSAVVGVVETSLASQDSRPVQACVSSEPGTHPGLTVANGIVVGADLIDEIGGYAGAAGTTGGHGGQLLTVTTLEDYGSHEPAIPGSLRNHLDTAQRNKKPAWIVFDRKLPAHARLVLKRTLRVPSNVTVDGSCVDITLEAPYESKTILTYISDGVQNVIISQLAMRKTGYVPESYPEAASTIVVNGRFDRVAIIHNDLSKCGHSCIDITVSPNWPLPERSRISILYNFIHDNDKVMLFGTYNCPQVGGLNTCSEHDSEMNRQTHPSMYLTVEGNVFARTGQRHPRIFGRVTAHVYNNLIAFKPLAYADGRLASSYGIFVSNGARALIESNLLLPLTEKLRQPLAVWTTGTPGAIRMPTDTEGFIRLEQNLVFRRAIARENKPLEVPPPDYGYEVLPMQALQPEDAVKCLFNRAGRGGSQTWHRELCGR